MSDRVEQGNAFVRQHYIPQFILRNFCHDEQKKKVYFFNAADRGFSVQNVSDVFMEKYLYADGDDPTETEKCLAKFESEIAEILKKFVNDREIVLSIPQGAALRIFLSLLAFRSVNTREQFRSGLSEDSRRIYSGGENGFDFEKLWLKNVRLLSLCRDMKDVMACEGVHRLVKLFFHREYSRFYTCLLEKRGEVDFAISDCYPTLMNVETDLPNGKKLNLPVYYFFPLSPERLLLLVEQNADCAPRALIRLDITKLRGPKRAQGGLSFRPVNIYEDDVEWINQMMIENAARGVVVKDLERRSEFLE